MKPRILFTYLLLIMLVACAPAITVSAQASSEKSKEGIRKASKKIERGVKKDNVDTLAQGYFELGESYYKKGELRKSEQYFQKSKNLYEKNADADGIAKSSRELGRVQEELNKNSAAIDNYNVALEHSQKIGDVTQNRLNNNDISRLSQNDTAKTQRLLESNISMGVVTKDTGEIVSNYSRMGDLNMKFRNIEPAVKAYTNAYRYSITSPEQAMQFNQRITDAYLQNKDFSKAIETKKEILGEDFARNSTSIQAKEINSLADIYIQKHEDTTAVRLLRDAYNLSVNNGHTLEAKKSLETLDSIYRAKGRTDLSLNLYQHFLFKLPSVISRDSSLLDTRIIAETEIRIRELESEKALKDSLIRRKNIFNYWLMGSILVLVLLIGLVLYTLRRLRVRNKKIALQSLRREMNPHFIFNSLNSINQFIANNNELEANRYLTRFSTLMRRVMENSKEDFVLFSREIELLQSYLELEKSRFPDKFDFRINIDDALLADEHIYIPGMLIQPHLENSIWHGLRYMDTKGALTLSFVKVHDRIGIVIEDNGIGIAASKAAKTDNQKKHSGRGITNTMERIKLLNELYHKEITCTVEDKPAPASGVKVKISVPLLKEFTP